MENINKEFCVNFVKKVYAELNGQINTVNLAKKLIVCEKSDLLKPTQANMMAFTTPSGLVIYPYWREIIDVAAVLNGCKINNDLIKSFLIMLVAHELSHQDQDQDDYSSPNEMEMSNNTRTYNWLMSKKDWIESEFKLNTFDPVLYLKVNPYGVNYNGIFKTTSRKIKCQKAEQQMFLTLYTFKDALINAGLINSALIDLFEGKYGIEVVENLQVDYNGKLYKKEDLNDIELEEKIIFLRGISLMYNPERNLLVVTPRTDLDISDVIVNPYGWKEG